MVKRTWFDGSGSVISIYERVQYRRLETTLIRFFVNCTFKYLLVKRMTQGSHRYDN